MPKQINTKTAKRTKSIFDIKKFGLDKKGDRALINFLDDPMMSDVHFIKAPEGGNFSGYYECLKMEDAEMDCPACNYESGMQDAPVGRAVTRYLVPIAEWDTDDRGDRRKNASASFRVWNMTENTWRKVLDKRDEYLTDEETGEVQDVIGIDIKVICTNGQWKVYDIEFPGGGRRGWEGTQQGREAHEEVMKELPDDISPLLCRTPDYHEFSEIVYKAMDIIPESDDDYYDPNESDDIEVSSEDIEELLGNR